MKHFDLFNNLSRAGYEGVDKDLNTSLFEYNLLVKDEGSKMHVIYCLGYDSNSNPISFSHGHIEKSEIDNIINKSWFDKKSFLSWLGISKQGWLKSSYANKLFDLFSYYGNDNIMGETYYPLSLLDLCRLSKNLRM